MQSFGPSEDSVDHEDFLRGPIMSLEDLASHVRSKEVPYGPHVAPAAGDIRGSRLPINSLNYRTA